MGKSASDRPAAPAVLLPPAGFVFDSSLHELAYRCIDGCPRNRTCCVGLAVEVSRREVRAIDAMMDQIVPLAPELRRGRAYENVFIDDPPDLLIEPRDDGSCPFLYRTRTQALCAIHSAALATGRTVAAVKPASCRHWPITVEPDFESRRVRVTVQPAAQHIGCVAPLDELPGHPPMIEAFRAEIEEICGVAPRSRR